MKLWFANRASTDWSTCEKKCCICLCARGKLEAAQAWASGEQSSHTDVKKWALDYFGQRNHTVSDDGTTKSVAQKHLDQQSVLLTWNGPWGEFSQDPLLLEVWPLFLFCFLLLSSPPPGSLQC